MNKDQLKQVAQALVVEGKGILAIDESTGTCKKRFEALNVPFTEENRRLYRQLLVTSPGIEEAVSGYILFDETIRQKTDDGTSFVDVLNTKGIMPGIKVDMGAKDMALHPGEKVTEGLDGLRDRLAEYVELGAKFTKWRAAIAQSETLPTLACMKSNAHALARYAALVQEAGLVPIVEPEMLIDGGHSLERNAEVSAQMWDLLFEELQLQGVYLEGCILKTSMIISGKDADSRAGVEQVAAATLQGLKAHVPSELAGVVFLSGGQSELESTQHLNAMNKLEEEKPWPLTFSYGRAIQQPALEIWAKNFDDVDLAQKALTHRALANGLASKGEYTDAFEENRGY